MATKSERKPSAFLSFLRSFLPFLKNAGGFAVPTEGGAAEADVVKHAVSRRKRHSRRHRRRKHVPRPQRKSKRDVESLLEQVDLDAMLGTAHLELPPAAAPSEAEQEVPPPGERPELSQAPLADEPAATPPPADGKNVEEMLRTVDLDAILGEVKPQQAEEESLPPDVPGEAVPEAQAKGEFLPAKEKAYRTELSPADRKKVLSAEAHSPRPAQAEAKSLPAVRGTARGEGKPGFWRRLAFWRRAPSPAAPPVPSAAAARLDIPLGSAPLDDARGLRRGLQPLGSAPAAPAVKQEEKPGALPDLDAILEKAKTPVQDGETKLRGGAFIRKEMIPSDLVESPPSPPPPPAPPPPKELTPAERKQLEELHRRQMEDEKALREQAEKHRKEEEERRKKELEAAKKEPAPAAALPKKRVSLRGHDNLFVGIANALRHFGLGKERFQIIQNLATMLNAGLPLVDSLRTLQMETRNRQARALIQRIMERVESGSPLWRAMQMEHFFTPDALALVRIGEEAGNLAENMQYLAAQQEKDEALRGKVKMAMIYPAIVLALMIIVIMGLGMFVLPNLISVLSSLNVPLPLVTRIVIGFSNLFSEHGTTVVPATLVGLVVLAVLVKYTPLQIVFQWFIFRIPGIGALLWEATIARFGVIVGGLLQAGVPLVDALRSLVDVTTILSYQRFYQRLLDHILVGDSFSKSFAVIRGSNKLLPLSVQQLVMTGERTGSLSKVMLKVADIYEKKANETAQKLPVILEPLLLLFIGGLVGTIAFAIIVPIYSIVGSVSR